MSDASYELDEFTTMPFQSAPGAAYSVGRPATVRQQAILATLALAVPLSSSCAQAEELWAAVFPQSSTVHSSPPEVRTARTSRVHRVLPPTAEQLTAIQSFFGLSKTQLSRVCGVQRQTVYDWYAGNFAAEGDNALRLARLFELVETLQLSDYRPLPARIVARALASGDTLLELLARDELDEEAVDNVFGQLQAATAAERGRGAAAIRARLGWSPTTTESASRNLETNLEDIGDG